MSGSNLGLTDCESEESQLESDVSVVASNAVLHSKTVTGTLLATAKIKLQIQEKIVVVRALVHPGAQCSFVPRRTASLLNVKFSRSSAQVSGVGGRVVATALGQITVSMLSCHDAKFRHTFTAYIIERLTSCLPNRSITNIQLHKYRDLQLAGPNWNSTQQLCLLS